jgi:hypothetical protein
MKNVNVQLSFLIRQRHMSWWQGAHAPYFGKNLKTWIFSIEACIQMTFFQISFHYFFLLISFET